MKTITDMQLVEAAYRAGLAGKLSDHCPRVVDGLLVPSEFEDGSESYILWDVAYRDGLEDSGSNMALGQQDMERDWQD